MGKAFHTVAKEWDREVHNLDHYEQEKEEYEQVYSEILSEARLTQNENRRIRLHMKDKFDVLTRNRDQLQENRDLLNEQFLNEEKLAKDLQDNYEKLRTKAK